MLVPTCPSEAWFQTRHALLERTGTMLMSTGFLNLFIQDREKRDLNTVTSDLQQRGCRWHALSTDTPDTAANTFDLSQCDPQKGTVCAEMQASHAVLCLLGVRTEHPQKSLSRMRRGLIAAIQHIEIPCEMQCVPLKVLLIAPKYLPQFSDFKWKIMQLWRQ